MEADRPPAQQVDRAVQGRALVLKREAEQRHRVVRALRRLRQAAEARVLRAPGTGLTARRFGLKVMVRLFGIGHEPSR